MQTTLLQTGQVFDCPSGVREDMFMDSATISNWTETALSFAQFTRYDQLIGSLLGSWRRACRLGLLRSLGTGRIAGGQAPLS